MGIQVSKGKFDAMLRPYVYNWRTGAGGNLSKWAVARGRMKAEAYNPKMLCMGTSKTMGAGAGTTDGSTFTVGASVKTKTKYFADILNARGVAVNTDCVVVGNGLTTQAAFLAYEPRFTITADWTFATAANNIGIGAGYFVCGSGSVGTMSFLPVGTCDRIDVWTPRRSDRGTFTVSDGATVVGTLNQNGSSGLIKNTYNLTSRANGKTINFNRTNAQALAVEFHMLMAWDSQTPAIQLVNAGRFGARASDFNQATNPWNPFPAIATYAPDLTTLAFGANELSNNSVPVATFATNVQNLITQAKLSGDVILVIEAMGDTTGNSWGSASNQQAFMDALYTLADTNDCPLINENGLLGGYVSAAAKGLMADGIHENARANAIFANTYADMVSM